jgi:DNA-directed RNA polymerase subunit M/transcription elongation factor TFIIS
MTDSSKPRYACPRCSTKIKVQFGNCPNCGYIGTMDDKDIYLKGRNAAGKPVKVDPPTPQSDSGKQKKSRSAEILARYTCPRCGAKAGKASGRCSNYRSCGYSGPMKTTTVSKPKLKQ